MKARWAQVLKGKKVATPKDKDKEKEEARKKAKADLKEGKASAFQIGGSIKSLLSHPPTVDNLDVKSPFAPPSAKPRLFPRLLLPQLFLLPSPTASGKRSAADLARSSKRLKSRDSPPSARTTLDFYLPRQTPAFVVRLKGQRQTP